jgi:hypothetical protein
MKEKENPNSHNENLSFVEFDLEPSTRVKLTCAIESE